VPRNRDARAAVLGSSVQRAAAYGQSAVRLRAVRRRVVVVGLVLACLALVTLSFRSTALNPVEGAAASVLRPFEIAANRVARPFRDATSWTHGLIDAKSENRRLLAANAALTEQVAQLKGQSQLASQLGAELHYIHSPAFPSGFNERAAEVLSSPTNLDQAITISAGSNNGLAPDDVVVADDDLVGIVTAVFPTEARVMLITNPESNVRAVDESDAAAIGIVDHGVGADTLIFDRIGKNLRVRDADIIVTAGSPAGGKFPSLFPRGIPIGSVSSVGQSDTQVYEEIQVEPFADLGSLETVLVLVPKS
jgi:rod shape-determining protein MreC